MGGFLHITVRKRAAAVAAHTEGTVMLIVIKVTVIMVDVVLVSGCILRKSVFLDRLMRVCMH
jgi:hypothetical protein